MTIPTSPPLDYLRAAIARLSATILDVDRMMLEDALVFYGPDSPQAQERRQKFEADLKDFAQQAPEGQEGVP